MELKFAMLADHVSETKEGKAIIIGEFDRIYAPEAPITYGNFFLIARFEARISEGTQHTLRMGVYDEDGGEVLPLSPELPLGFVPTGPGKPLRGNVIVQVGSMNLPRFGDYEFHLLVDGRHMASVPFTFFRVEQAPEQQ